MFNIIKYWKESIICSLFCFSFLISNAQEFMWYNPLKESALEGRVNTISSEDEYARLPKILKDQVRQPVWDLGQDAAGIYVEFKTNSTKINVKYKVTKGLNMPHMPTTGVSGLDLYAQDNKSGNWNWIHGSYSFKDTVTYSFSNYGIHPDFTYRLYLPLYNSVEWMEIGVEVNKNIEFVHAKSKPIIIYGTSIAQGACASRPGLAWTNWLGRNFKEEVINLAFSGNGRLEQPLLDLIKVEDASVYILDCLPNLSAKGADEPKLIELINNAVKTIRDVHPKVPIVIAAHSSSYVPSVINENTNDDYNSRTVVGERAVKELQKKGDKNLYWLSEKEIGLDINSTVDYAHPNDFGMEKIASAYTKLLKRFLK